ncbi:hypothetical protein BDQ17DRAFT_1329210 [Cyathus striatus]|nr:hypothetical protein BDQ17DRAFT_1329210 [Cyathus striatus]
MKAGIFRPWNTLTNIYPILEERDFPIEEDLDARWLYDDDVLEYRDHDHDVLEYRDYDDNFCETRDYEYDLMDRDYYATDVELRGAGVMIGLAADYVGGIFDIGKAVQAGIEEDKVVSVHYPDLLSLEPTAVKTSLTKDLVHQIAAKYPKFNVVVCHVKHETKFDGKEGVEWGHSRQSFTNVKIGFPVPYDIYWFKSGYILLLASFLHLPKPV